MKISIILISLFITSNLFAISLSDYTPYNYKVLFTNPECKEYNYEAPVISNSGEILYSKPKNVYCKRGDEKLSASRDSSPSHELIKWISDDSTKEIFFSFLSYSNQVVTDALCKAIRERNVKVEFMLDQGTRKKMADKLLSCVPDNSFLKPNIPKVYYRGKSGGIGYAHKKYFIINPKSKDEVKIAFGSGNLSAGVVLHHENWHFVTTNINSYFAQFHLCMKEGTLNYRTKSKYIAFIKECRRNIEAVEEDDIKVFSVPGEGKMAMSTIRKALFNANSISFAAHRFSNKDLISSLKTVLNSESDISVRMIADDDLYWVYKDRSFVAPNMVREFYNVNDLRKKGMDVKYMETNHGSHYLHHNKFIIFEGRESALFTGAGNFTQAAFSKNFENFYYITIPEVVDAFKEQYKKMFDEMATSYRNLPRKNISI